MRKNKKVKTLLGVFRRKSIAVVLAFLMVFSQVGYSIPPADNVVTNRPGAIKTGKVDMASGNLSFVENIFSLKGYKLAFKYNTEGLSEDVKSINGDKTTGVVGLGWKLSKDRIVRLTHQTANTSDDEYLLNAHGKISKLTFEGEVGDTIHFRLPSSPYWRIMFLENLDQWIVQKDNGKKYIYGDGRLINHLANSTEKGIKWDNWIGSSIVNRNKSQMSVAWNLSQIENHVGEKAQLEYLQDTETVGARNNYNRMTFTKASYLRKVTGMDGNFIVLEYEDKEQQEFEDPHVENTTRDEQRSHGVIGPDIYSDNDAFQERYEDKYLARVTRSSYSNHLDRKAEFSYGFVGEGQLTKRVLTEIQYLNKNNSQYQPSKKFDYYSNADGVNVGLTAATTNVFNVDNGALFGAIKSITIPGGGSYIYRYDQVEIGGSSLTFDIPFPKGYKYTDVSKNTVTVGWLAPKLFFMDDYVVVIHELNAHDRKLSNIGICTWTGDRWKHQDFGIYEGHFFDRYHEEAYHEKNVISTIKDGLLNGMSEKVPALGGIMNAFNDFVTDEMTNLYKEATDLAKGDIGAAIKDWFLGDIKVLEDVFLDLFASLEKEIEDYEYILADLFGLKNHQLSEQQLVEKQQAYIAKNPRKKYHITLQKDFFAISNSQGTVSDKGDKVNQDVHIFEKDPLVQGKWDRFSMPVRVTSKYFDLHSGNQFVALFDECTDGLFTFTKDKYLDWKGAFIRINQVVSDDEFNRMGQITANIDVGIQEYFGSMPDEDQDYLNMLAVNKRSTVSAHNNFIIVATSEANGANARIQMFHHNKNKEWNWATPAQVRFDKTLIPIEIAGPLASISQGLASNSLLQLKAGNSIASLQVYDNLNMEILNDILEVTTGGVGATDGSTNALNPLSTIQKDFVQDISAMNATYGIVWNEDMSEINVSLLHASIGQTGIKTFVNGNVIQKIGKAYSPLIGAQEGDDNGINYAFRYDGEKFVTAKFASDYYTSAMAPDVASQLVEAADKAYKTPVFRQYNANRPTGSFVTEATRGSVHIENGQVTSINPTHLLVNVPPQEAWSIVDNASQELINAPEFVKEAIHVSSDILNLVIQVIMMIIPFAGELVAAEQALSAIDKVTQVASLAAMAINPAGDALVDKILGVNHKSTSIANNYLSTNGKLFARTPNGSWTELGRAFNLGGNDELVGLNNELSNGYYNYTVKRQQAFSDPANNNASTNIQNYVTILKNRQIYENISLNQYVDGQALVVRKDSLTMTGGNGAFVAYGPANNEGYIIRNENIVRPKAQNAEQRRRKQSYEDATIIRLHKVADEQVAGTLKDFVVKSVETNTGYESTYTHYRYDSETAMYNDSHGAAVFPKVDVYPSTRAELPPNPEFGGYSYYFYNNENYVNNNGQAFGHAQTASSLTNEELVTFHAFDYRDSKDFAEHPVNPLLGRQYMMEVFDSNSEVISRTIDCHVLFEHDFFYRTSSLELDKVYQALSSTKISMMDGVSTKLVNKYEDNYRAVLPRTVEHHSTSITGEPEISYKSKTYAFEHYPALWEQNRIHETSFVIDSVRKGNQVHILDATVTTYAPENFNYDEVWMVKNTYKADGVQDLVNPNMLNYQSAAAAEVAVQDRDYADYDALLTAYETEVGHYDIAYRATVGANRAAVNSLNQIVVSAHEVAAAHTNLELELLDLNSNSQDLIEARQIVTDAQNTLNRDVQLLNEATQKVNEAQQGLDDAYYEKQWALGVAFAVGGLIGLGIAEAIENDKVQKAYDKLQSAKVTKDARLKAKQTAQSELLSVQSHLSSLESQHQSVAAAVAASKTALSNAEQLYNVTEEASHDALESANVALRISSVKNTALTTHAHSSTVPLHTTSVEQHTSFIEQANSVKNTLNEITAAINRTENPAIYGSVQSNVQNVLTKIDERIAKHSAHIANVYSLKDQHNTVIEKASNLDVSSDDLADFNGRNYNWYEMHSVKQRDARTGAPVSSVDAKGVVTSHLLDASSRFVVASATDADLNNNEAFYLGFEPYEKRAAFSLIDVSGQKYSLYTSRSGFFENTIAAKHTGESALRVSRTGVKIQPSVFNANPDVFYADSAYVISAFVKIQDQGRVWVGADTLQFANAPDEAKLDRQTEGFKYIEAVVIGADLIRNSVPTLHIDDAWRSPVIIDDIMVRPLSADFEATVYNNRGIPTAKINRNGLTKHMFYDSHDRLQTVVDDYGRIYGMNLAAFSRDGVRSGNFDPERPNEATSFSFIEYGKMLTRFDIPDYNGNIDTESNDALLSFKLSPLYNDNSHSARLTAGPFSFTKNGSQIRFMVRGQQQPFKLQGFPEDWTIAKIADMAYLWVNGKYIKGVALNSSELSQNLNLNYNIQRLRLDEIVIGKKPLFKVDYTNGIGQHMQMLRPHFENDGSYRGLIRKASLYDGWGHKAVTTLPVFAQSKELAYEPELVTSFDWTTGLMEGQVTDYYQTNQEIVKGPNDHNYPYFRTYFADYPISRAVKMVKPGFEFHNNRISGYDSDDNTSNETHVDYQEEEAEALLQQFGLNNTDFATKKQTSSLGTKNIEVKDKMGRKVLTKKGDAISKNVNTYTEEGFVVDSVYSPNHFDNNKNTTGNMFASSHANKGLLNLHSVNISPDRGRVELIKCQKGKNVFIKTASSEATAQKVGEIKYYLYDEQDRVTEQGIYHAKWDAERLNTLSKAPFWYDANMEMVKSFRYDIDDNNSALYNKGRITRTLHQTNEGLVKSSFSYNVYGQITANRLDIFDENNRKISSDVVTYEYYPSGQVKKITYPNGFEVTYTFNRAGKISAIGTPEDSDLFATYRFDNLDRLQSESRDNGQYYSNIHYDFRGRQKATRWFNTAEENIFREELNFVSGGKYYDTKISTIRYGGTMYSNIQHNYQYDSQDRLVNTATNMNQGTQLSSINYTDYNYDKNSNLESVVNSSSPNMELNYMPGTNQDLLNGVSAYDADGLKVRFSSNVWGDNSHINYSNYTHKPEVIFKASSSAADLNTAKWFKIASTNYANIVLNVKSTRIVEAAEGDELTATRAVNAANQFFRFELVDGGTYKRLIPQSNENLAVHYSLDDGFYLDEPSTTSSDKFIVEANSGLKGAVRILPQAYANKRMVIVQNADGSFGVNVETTPRLVAAKQNDNASFKFVAVDNASPSDEFVSFNYDAKNNRVMKVRNLTSVDQTLKQDTLIYIHGNNRLPLSEVVFGSETNAQGVKTPVSKVSNYIYGPGFGSIAVRVFDDSTEGESAEGITPTRGGNNHGSEEEENRVNATYSLLPTDDSHTFIGNRNANFGTSQELQVKLDGADYTRFAYLKFNLSEFNGDNVRSVKLRLVPTAWRGKNTPFTNYRVFSISNDAWSERSITYANQPTLRGESVLDSQLGSSEVIEWYVTDWFNSQRNGDEIMSLSIGSLNSSSTGHIGFHSKESSSVNSRPQLIIEYQRPADANE